MKLIVIVFGFLFLAGFAVAQPAPKGVCPLKEGVMRPVEDWESVVGTMKATVKIVGKDSLVRSATNGRVREVGESWNFGSRSVGTRIAIMRDTATYTYFGFDSCLVKEGQMVKAGQVIGIAKTHKINFFVSNYLYTHLSTTPQNYVDCICELPGARQ